VNKREQARREELARDRTVHGWAFRALPEDEKKAIRAFLDGGECPEGYRTVWLLARRQLGLPDLEAS
jgi:hypothetical protein